MKTDLCFQKWHGELGKFSPEHSKVSKLGLSLDSFIQIRKRMTLKFTGEFCVVTMKNDAKFQEELTCCFNIGMRNLTNFDPSTWKSQRFAPLMGSFWSKYIMFELKIYRGVMLFLRYKKILKKAVKLGSFLQYSVHIFLGHDGYFWKINLRILWNHIMKNFQVKHGKLHSIILPRNVFF